MSGIHVEFQRVGKRFGRRSVLAGITGRLQPGRVLVITGPNGSGKSTLLNILAGLMRPSSGTVTYLEGDDALPRAHWFQRLGVVAPDMAVYEELTGLENLRFFARVRGLTGRTDEMTAILADMGLPEREQRRPVATYSSGMRQRVKLAQAVIHEPQVLLLDEPSSNLDTAGHEVVAAMVRRFRATAAVALATNDPRESSWGDAAIELSH